MQGRRAAQLSAKSLYAASQVIAHPLPYGRGSAVDSEPRASASGLEPGAGINGAVYSSWRIAPRAAVAGNLLCGGRVTSVELAPQIVGGAAVAGTTVSQGAFLSGIAAGLFDRSRTEPRGTTAAAFCTSLGRNTLSYGVAHSCSRTLNAGFLVRPTPPPHRRLSG